MADLEDLLLEAAGRTNASGRKQHSRPPPRHHRGSSSDDGSDSRDDGSDDNSAYVSRQQLGSQVPPRKRLDLHRKDDDEDSDDNDNHQGGSSDESDVGSDLYKDDYDREKLAQMSELDREMILSERAQRRDDQRLTERVRAKQSGKKNHPAKETPPPPSSHLRSSARSTERAAAKDDALNELRARRQKRQEPVRRTFTEAENPSESDESGSHDRDEGSVENQIKDDIDEDRIMDKEVVTYEDIKEITIRRSKLANWVMEPFFEELIVGCFVRVGVGRKGDKNYYRLCVVKKVDATSTNEPYELENKRTHKYLNVAWGNAERMWAMAVISDSAPTELEFDQWVDTMKQVGVRLPSPHDVREKQEAIQKANTYVYSPATVKQMLQEKKSVSSRPLNIAAEKDRLRKDMEAAKLQQDEAEVERIQARLQELEAISRKAKEKDEKAMKLEAMNRKNRFENFRMASEMKPVNTSLKAGEAGYDPFSRRWTRSRNYYIPGGGDETATSAKEDANAKSSEGSNGAGEGGAAETGMATMTAALEAAAGAGKLVDRRAPVDQGTASNLLHNFELPISLTKLQTFEGPQALQRALMARKQKIEATIGVKVPEDDGKKHPHAISINDYKRRRGLL